MSKALLAQLVYMGMGAVFFLIHAIKINLLGFLIEQAKTKDVDHILLTLADLVFIFIATTLAWPMICLIWASEKED